MNKKQTKVHKTKNKQKKSNRKYAKERYEQNQTKKSAVRESAKKSKLKGKLKQDGRPILLTPISLRVLLRLPKPLNRICVVYYLFLLLLCVERKTNRVWCNDNYAAEGLNCSSGLIEKAKAQLVKSGYIRIEQEHTNEDGHFGKAYIVCKHYARRSTIEDALRLYSQPSQPGNFRTKESILAEIEKKMDEIEKRTDERLEDSLQRAKELVTKRARQEQSTVTTKNKGTVKKKQSTVTTKNRDTVKQGTNTYRAKGGNTYRAKEKLTASGGGVFKFLDFESKLIKVSKQDLPYYKLAQQLYKALMPEKKQNIKQWSFWLRKLNVVDLISQDRIENMVSLHIEFMDDKSWPKINNAKGFYYRWEDITRAARKKTGEEQSRNDDETKEWIDEHGKKHKSVSYKPPTDDYISIDDD